MQNNFANIVLPVGRAGPGGVTILGTAFAVAPNKIATAAHVTEQNDDGLVIILPRIAASQDYQDTTNNSINTTPVKISAYDPLRDIAILTGNFANTFTYQIAGADISPPGSGVITVGYPHSNYGRLVLTEQSTTVGARILLSAGPLKAKHLVLNIQTRPGQSGSPVYFHQAPSRVVAMVLGSWVPQQSGISLGGIDPATLHQTTHAISAEYIEAML